jgi:ATP-dependent RNA helicase DDX10/DBP4
MLSRLSSLKAESLVKLDPNPEKIADVQSKLVGICTQYPSIKYLAQRSILSYIRSVHLQPDKGIFSIPPQDTIDKFSFSLGLAASPPIFFGKRSGNKNTNYDLVSSESEAEAPEEILAEDDLLTKKDIGVHETKAIEQDSGGDKQLKIKKKRDVIKKQKISVEAGLLGHSRKRIVYDDEGKEVPVYYDDGDNGQSDLIREHQERSRAQLKNVDLEDRMLEKEKKRAKSMSQPDLEQQALRLLRR